MVRLPNIYGNVVFNWNRLYTQTVDVSLEFHMCENWNLTMHCTKVALASSYWCAAYTVFSI